MKGLESAHIQRYEKLLVQKRYHYSVRYSLPSILLRLMPRAIPTSAVRNPFIYCGGSIKRLDFNSSIYSPVIYTSPVRGPLLYEETLVLSCFKHTIV